MFQGFLQPRLEKQHSLSGHHTPLWTIAIEKKFSLSLECELVFFHCLSSYCHALLWTTRLHLLTMQIIVLLQTSALDPNLDTFPLMVGRRVTSLLLRVVVCLYCVQNMVICCLMPPRGFFCKAVLARLALRLKKLDYFWTIPNHRDSSHQT